MDECLFGYSFHTPEGWRFECWCGFTSEPMRSERWAEMFLILHRTRITQAKEFLMLRD